MVVTQAELFYFVFLFFLIPFETENYNGLVQSHVIQMSDVIQMCFIS